MQKAMEMRKAKAKGKYLKQKECSKVKAASNGEIHMLKQKAKCKRQWKGEKQMPKTENVMQNKENTKA